LNVSITRELTVITTDPDPTGHMPVPSLEQMGETVAELSAYPHPLYAVRFDTTADDYNGDDEVRRQVEIGPEADVIGSDILDRPGMHTVMLDIDGPVAALPYQGGGGSAVFLGLTADPFAFRKSSHIEAVSELLVSSGIATAAGWVPTLPGKGEALAFRTTHAVHVVPTSTPGHHHLYVDAPVTLAELLALMNRLVVVNVIERGYADASANRGAAHLRLPWVRKGGVQ
jgi:hypothetical protein